MMTYSQKKELRSHSQAIENEPVFPLKPGCKFLIECSLQNFTTGLQQPLATSVPDHSSEAQVLSPGFTTFFLTCDFSIHFCLLLCFLLPG